MAGTFFFGGCFMHLLQASFPRSAAKATRMAIAVGAIAGLAVVGACSDNAGKTISGPSGIQSPRNATIGSGGLSFSGVVQACISNTSPAGTYQLVNTEFLSGFENGGTGITQPNAPVGTPYAVSVGGCVTVETRVKPDDSFPGFADTWSGITVGLSSNLGAVYDSTNCIEDVGVKHTVPGPCGTANSATRAFMNIQHGTQLVYFFSPGTQHCAGTIGWFKNQGADLVASWGLFYSSGQTATFVLNDSPKGNGYVILAQQYIAAFLAVGNAPPVSIASVMASSNTFFTGRPYRNTDGYSKSTLTDWSNTLADFNAGKFKDWPHC
jgi:hypothetical protein